MGTGAGAVRASLCPRGDGWSPIWVAKRSLAVCRARGGDPELLRQFIAHDLNDDICEAASLNYWAYWLGQAGRPSTATPSWRPTWGTQQTASYDACYDALLLLSASTSAAPYCGRSGGRRAVTRLPSTTTGSST